MCHCGGRRYGSYCPLTPRTKDIESNTAQLFFRTKTCAGTLLFLLHVLGKAVHETHSPFLLGVWMQRDFQGIYEGQKSSLESLKLTQNTEVS